VPRESKAEALRHPTLLFTVITARSLRLTVHYGSSLTVNGNNFGVGTDLPTDQGIIMPITSLISFNSGLRIYQLSSVYLVIWVREVVTGMLDGKKIIEVAKIIEDGLNNHQANDCVSNWGKSN
jgi:hypothetical protein